MRKKIKQFFKGAFSLILIAIVVYIWTYAPVMTGFAAQAICSGIFVSGRPIAEIERDELKSFPCFHIPKYTINYYDSSVTATFLGMASKTAVYRKGLGATLINKMTVGELRKQRMILAEPPNEHQETIAWPQGNLISDTLPNGVDTMQIAKTVKGAFYNNDDSVSPTRAILVVYNNQIIFEKYSKGFDAYTKQTGWSMAKSITNAMIGVMVKQGRLSISMPAPIVEWQNDKRKKITLTNLMQLNSGLRWWEFAASASTQTNMLFKQDDMAGYALNEPFKTDAGKVFNYSDGSVNILQLIIRRTLSDSNYYRFPYEQLFYKIGMLSAVIEPDASGTFTGSSYVFATARDWARLGLLYLHDGVWNNERILPEGWVNFSTTQSYAKNVHKGGRYGAGWWVNQDDVNDGRHRVYQKLPADCFYAQGYDGQYVWIIPSKNLVVVRLARDAFYQFNPDDFLADLIKALPK